MRSAYTTAEQKEKLEKGCKFVSGFGQGVSPSSERELHAVLSI